MAATGGQAGHENSKRSAMNFKPFEVRPVHRQPLAHSGAQERPSFGGRTSVVPQVRHVMVKSPSVVVTAGA